MRFVFLYWVFFVRLLVHATYRYGSEFLHNFPDSKRTLQDWNANRFQEYRIKSSISVPVDSLFPSHQTLWLGIEADCSYLSQFTSRVEAKKHILQEIEKVSSLYDRSFHVYVQVLQLTLPSSEDCFVRKSVSENGAGFDKTASLEEKLNSFTKRKTDTKFEKNHLIPNPKYLSLPSEDATSQTVSPQAWLLLTTSNDTKEKGISWFATICNGFTIEDGWHVGPSSVVAAYPNDWPVIAHELGHIFGLIHDCDKKSCQDPNESCCPLSQALCDAQGLYVMHPSNSYPRHRFSDCSILQLHSLLAKNYISFSCLSKPSEDVGIRLGMCGNGIVEGDEECDCGDDCSQNPCCDGKTCKYAAGAVCDDSKDSCCKNCQLSRAGMVCRKASGSCDKPEFCTGKSAECPKDEHWEDGRYCSLPNANGYCASGKCTSPSEQCRELTNFSVSACQPGSCKVSCMNDNGVCYSSSMNYLDGTRCAGGLCYNGNCIPVEETSAATWRKQPSLFCASATMLISLALIAWFFW
ncbi:spore wall assembly peptidase Mde10 [Schizosaccharomyces octosporus yFS286]|uniref:Disintegrin and metalloproteinase domain-containing protein B n=1 Tax=Schizosaccharomyces octosporus (strain yFS286) TaxID=483514 RepID=S9PUV9_SCHOY|nr:spore wall assembly peptidase Mde10 [Schizosaccharomyces octosporus yFS286]EPX71303.1 spore wall assembly peptidase Mde10 [Schizosaccharomyces octosporus yFS286]